MYVVGIRADGSHQPYLRNKAAPSGVERWFFPAHDTAFLRRLAKAFADLADDMDRQGIPERDVD